MTTGKPDMPGIGVFHHPSVDVVCGRVVTDDAWMRLLEALGVATDGGGVHLERKTGDFFHACNQEPPIHTCDFSLALASESPTPLDTPP